MKESKCSFSNFKNGNTATPQMSPRGDVHFHKQSSRNDHNVYLYWFLRLTINVSLSITTISKSHRLELPVILTYRTEKEEENEMNYCIIKRDWQISKEDT